MNCVAVYRETPGGLTLIKSADTNEWNGEPGLFRTAEGLSSLALGNLLVRNSAGSTAYCRDKFHVVDLSFSRYIPGYITSWLTAASFQIIATGESL
jgi:hypothetical protein